MGTSEMRFESVRTDLLDISKYNVRTKERDQNIDELTESIKLIGLQQPILVTPKPNGRYDVIIGQRRLKAVRQLGWKTIPAIINPGISDETDALIVSFSENIQRMDLNYQDKMQVAQRLMNKLGSVKAVATAIGVTTQTIRNYLGYASVPEPIRELVREGKISKKTAIRLIRNVEDEEKAIKIALKINEVPRNEQKSKIITVAKENPEKTPEEIVEIATKRFDLTIDLTPDMAESLQRASEDFEVEREIIAVDALSIWLKDKGYLN